MSTLKTNQVNTKISERLIEVAIGNVRNNYTIDKSCPVEKYYCPAIIEPSSIDIGNAMCTISLVNTETETIFYNKENFKLSFLPVELLKNAKKAALIHVLVCLKLFYYSVLETTEMTLIVPIGEELGYFDDDVLVTAECRKSLCHFYEKRKEAWLNSLALPSYKTLSELENTTLLKVKSLMSA
jgi:hypothetical protein